MHSSTRKAEVYLRACRDALGVFSSFESMGLQVRKKRRINAFFIFFIYQIYIKQELNSGRHVASTSHFSNNTMNQRLTG